MKRIAPYAIIASVAVAAGIAAFAYAAIPQQINYQSRLRTSAGTPVTTATKVSFSLYSAASGGTALWTETRDQSSGSCAKVTPDADGYFSVQLGSCAAFPGSLTFGTPLFLGVTIENDAEATPRVSFSPSPYALNASRVGPITVSAGNDVGINTATPGALLHVAGTGKFDGVLTAHDIMPDGDNLYDIGTHTNRFRTGYFKDVIFGDTVRLGSENNTDFARFTLPKLFISASSTAPGGDILNIASFERTGTTFLEDVVMEKLLSIQDRKIRFGTNTFTFPASFPTTNGQVLSGTTSGDLSWTDGASGTVTSVDLDLPSIFSVSGNPITSAGTITASLVTQTGNTFFASPDGSNGAPSFRAIVAGDIPVLDTSSIPNLDASKIATGVLPVARGGTGLGSFTANSLIYASGATTIGQIPVGSNGEVLTITGGVPTWASLPGSGTVTSVALTAPSIFTVSGSPITGSGTLGIALDTQNANAIFAGPSSGADAAPTFRSLVAADIPLLSSSSIPNIDASKVVSGVFAPARIPALASSSIPDLDASQITTGIFGIGRIPNLDASKITSGTFDIARIPDIPAANINGTLATSSIPNLDASKITTGILPIARGGTNLSSYTANGVLYAPTSSSIGQVAAGSNGEVLTLSGGVPTWASAASGTVTSAGIALPSIFSVSGSPITSSGTTTATLVSQTANTFFAAPNGSNGAPAFRALVAADVPTLNQNTTGTASNITGILGAGSFPALSGDVTTSAGSLVTTIGAGKVTNAMLAGSIDASKISSGTFALSRIPAGTNGQVLTTVSGAPAWANAASGTVTSVALTTPSFLSVAGSPITSSGSLDITLASQTAGTIFAAPAGANGAPSFRAIVASDIPALSTSSIPNLDASKITTGVFGAALIPGLDVSKIVSGVFGFNRGGLGFSTSTKGDIVYAPANNAIDRLPIGASGQVLTVAAGVPTWAPGASGTVTSAGIALPSSVFSVANSPITSSGTSTATFVSQTAKTFFAAPNAADGTPAFRALMASDVPTLNQNTTGTASNITGVLNAASFPALTGDVTTSAGSLVTTIGDGKVTNAMLAGSIDASKISTGTFALARIPAGTNGQVLTTVSGAPAWANANAGTVTSVALTAPSIFTVSGSPVTSSGTLSMTLASQSAGLVLASPSGSAGAPAFRALVAADIPNIDASKITSGTLAVARGGTGLSSYTANGLIYAPTSGTVGQVPSGANGSFLTLVSGVPTWSALPASGDISGIGTTSTIALFSGAKTIGNSGITQSGGNIDITSGSLSFGGTTRITGAGAATFATTTISGTNQLVANNVAIGGGAINGTVIGGTTPNAGTFSTLTSTGNVNVGLSVLPTAGTANIGSPAARFATLYANQLNVGATTTINGISYTWPGSAPANGTVLTATASGLSWTAGASGTVTSAGIALPSSVFSVANSPITSSGTTTATLVSQTANTFFAAPNGASGTPVFRTLVAADVPLLASSSIPGIDASKIVSGVLGVANGGTGLSSVGANGRVLTVVSGAPAWAPISDPVLTSASNAFVLGGNNFPLSPSPAVLGTNYPGALSIKVNNIVGMNMSGIDGSVTFPNNVSIQGGLVSDIVPDADNSRRLGSSARRFQNIWANMLSASSTLFGGTLYSWPLSTPTAGQVLSYGAGGALSWVNGAAGTVTSVGITAPASVFATSSPVTTSGNLGLSLTVQNPNKVFAGPQSGASDAVPTFRTLVAADIPALASSSIPNLDASKITSGTLAVTRGGTGLSSYTANGLLYAPSASTIGQVLGGSSGQVLTLNGSGVPIWAAPASGAASGWVSAGGRVTLATSTDSVGIGTATPNNKLQVTGLINFDDLNQSTYLGYQAGAGRTTNGGNTIVGYNALRAIGGGGSNTAVGSLALESTTSGNANTGVGLAALRANTVGQRNTAVGDGALQSSVSGDNSTAVGDGALSSATGAANTAVGQGAFSFSSTGNNNAGFGNSVLAFVAGGSRNTAIGSEAGLSGTLTSVNDAVFVGYQAMASVNNLTNVIAIGSGAQATQSNQAVIGNSSITETLLRGVVTNSLKVTGGTLGVGKVLTSDGQGNATWQSIVASGDISGTGTTSTVPMWSGAKTLANSTITVSGATTTIGAGQFTNSSALIGGSLAVSGQTTIGSMRANGTITTDGLKIANGAPVNSILQIGDTQGTVTQVAQPTANGQVLTYNGTALGWSLPSAASCEAPVFSGDKTITGDLSVGGVSSNLIPSAANTYDLGSAAKPWRDIYVSSSTLKFVDDTGQVDATLSLTKGGDIVLENKETKTRKVLGEGGSGGLTGFASKVEDGQLTLSATAADAAIGTEKNAIDIFADKLEAKQLRIGTDGVTGVKSKALVVESVDADGKMGTVGFASLTDERVEPLAGEVSVLKSQLASLQAQFAILAAAVAAKQEEATSACMTGTVPIRTTGLKGSGDWKITGTATPAPTKAAPQPAIPAPVSVAVPPVVVPVPAVAGPVSVTQVKTATRMINVYGNPPSSDMQWNNIGNGQSQASNSASASARKGQILSADGFGFSIPANAKIESISVTMSRKSQKGTTADDTVYVLKNGALVGTDLAVANEKWPAASFASATFVLPGGAFGLTPADLNGAFSVGIRPTLGGTDQATVGSVSVTVKYTAL